MPKLKVHRGAKKRVKLSGKGKFLHAHAAKNHFLSKKTASRKRAYSKEQHIDASDNERVKRALGV